MAEDNNNLFDVNAPAPTPITLTFGEEGAPESHEETPSSQETQEANKAAAEAAVAVQEAKDILSEVQSTSGATGNAAADAAASKHLFSASWRRLASRYSQ